MIKTLLIASLATGALALPAPASLAGHVTYDCAVQSLAQETSSGGQLTYTGVLYGFAASPDPGERPSFRCYIAVDGTEVASAPPVVETPSLVVVAGTVTYTASDGQTVQVCAEWSAGSESGTECFDSVDTRIPPPEVVDFLDALRDFVIDTYLLLGGALFDCPVLVTIGSTGVAHLPGVLAIDSTGDVYVLGEQFANCPPYRSGRQ